MEERGRPNDLWERPKSEALEQGLAEGCDIDADEDVDELGCGDEVAGLVRRGLVLADELAGEFVGGLERGEGHL